MSQQSDARDGGIEVRVAVIETELRNAKENLKLQADEYERRLSTLNHEHARTNEVQSQSVTSERFEEYTKVEAEKRELALDRVNEKLEEQVGRLQDNLNDYITRAEARQRELEHGLQLQKSAAEEATRIAEREAEKTREAYRQKADEQKLEAEERTRRQNLKLGIGSVVAAIFVAIVNGVGPF